MHTYHIHVTMLTNLREMIHYALLINSLSLIHENYYADNLNSNINIVLFHCNIEKYSNNSFFGDKHHSRSKSQQIFMHIAIMLGIAHRLGG